MNVLEKQFAQTVAEHKNTIYTIVSPPIVYLKDGTGIFYRTANNNSLYFIKTV